MHAVATVNLLDSNQGMLILEVQCDYALSSADYYTAVGYTKDFNMTSLF